MPDISNVRLGVCNVVYDGTDLGATKGGVEVEVETETHKVMVDQFGNTPIKEYITARSCVVRVPLAESTLENLAIIFPGSTFQTHGGNVTRKRLRVPTGTGTDLRTISALLYLHPKANAVGDKNEDFTIPLAGVKGNISYAYKLDEERIFNVEFQAYPDQNDILFVAGDADIVPA